MQGVVFRADMPQGDAVAASGIPGAGAAGTAGATGGGGTAAGSGGGAVVSATGRQRDTHGRRQQGTQKLFHKTCSLHFYPILNVK